MMGRMTMNAVLQTGIFDPIPDDIVKQPLVDNCQKYQEYKDVKVGDYLIKVG